MVQPAHTAILDGSNPRTVRMTIVLPLHTTYFYYGIHN